MKFDTKPTRQQNLPSRSILVILLLVCLTPGLLTAETDDEALRQKASDSIVILTAASQGLCGTGFILESGLIATTWHVIDSICNGASCGDLKARRLRGDARNKLEALTEGPLNLRSALPGIDLAFLDPGATGIAGAFKLSKQGIPEGRLHMAGFSYCQGLEFSDGTIRSQNSLHLFTTLRGAPGNSGSPVFTDNFELVGMVDEAADLMQGLTGRALSLGYELRALHGRWLALAGESPQSLELDATALLQYYRQDILTLPPEKRLIAGLGYIAAAGALRRQAIVSSDDADFLRPLSLFDDYPFAILNLPDTADRTAASGLLTQLALSSALEQKGLRSGAVEVLNVPEAMKQLNSGQDKAQAQAMSSMLRTFAENGYPGVELYLIKLCAKWVIWGSLLLGAFFITIGYAYAARQGSRLSRLLFTLGVALLWPFSIIYLLLKKRKGRESAPES